MTPSGKRYQTFREAFLGGLLAETHDQLPSEIELQSQWFSGAFGKTFSNGIEILEFGEWNHGAGPDFLNAIISFSGTIKKGAIEIDKHPKNWELHKHHLNPAFNECILHLSFQEASSTYFFRTSENREIPSLNLSHLSPNSSLTKHQTAPNLLAHPGTCSAPLADLTKDRLTSLLKEAAMHRAQRKSNQFLSIQRTQGKEQALWQALARTLGYHPNQLAMEVLSQRLPVRTWEPEKMEALLLGAAGFLAPHLHEKAPPESRAYIEQLWVTWWKYRQEKEIHEERSIPWTMNGLRPQNHPHRRVGALATLATHWKTLFSTFQSDLEQGSFVTMNKALAELSHPFWSQHYTLTSSSSSRPIALFGKSRAQDFIINHLLPLQLHQHDSFWDQYEQVKAPPASQPIKTALTRLLGKREDLNSWTKYAWQQQGLLEIYRDFCASQQEGCLHCPFSQQLQQW